MSKNKINGSNYDYIQTEVPLYGSARLGEWKPNILVKTFPTSGIPTYSCISCPVNLWTIDIGLNNGFYPRKIFKKEYELDDHLGNVHTTVSDRKNADSTAFVISYNDYYPGGMLMPGRTFSSNLYRFGFNKGSEKDDEIYGTGNAYTTEFRELDTRLGGRWWSLDPKGKAWESPYVGFSDNPIVYSDPKGTDVKDPKGTTEHTGNGIATSDNGKTIHNDPNAKESNWDYGTWNKETGKYDLHSTDNETQNSTANNTATTTDPPKTAATDVANNTIYEDNKDFWAISPTFTKQEIQKELTDRAIGIVLDKIEDYLEGKAGAESPLVFDPYELNERIFKFQAKGRLRTLGSGSSLISPILNQQQEIIGIYYLQYINNKGKESFIEKEDYDFKENYRNEEKKFY
ncbi:MAG: hypothetical protein ABI199_05700 [Bacteroidia bacterium]